MTQSRSLNLQIQSAKFEQLSDLARAVLTDRKLTATEKLVLERGLANRREYLAKALPARLAADIDRTKSLEELSDIARNAEARMYLEHRPQAERDALTEALKVQTLRLAKLLGA